MGVLRTLILFDGHRAPPSTPDGFVDLDTIPQMLLKRVDVVTGGVSAVYGSDAIVGAVNFVTDTAFEGIKGQFAGGPLHLRRCGHRRRRHCLRHRTCSVVVATSWAVSRRATAAPIDSKFARPWGKNVYTLQGFGTAAQPYYQVSGARMSEPDVRWPCRRRTIGEPVLAIATDGTRFD